MGKKQLMWGIGILGWVVSWAYFAVHMRASGGDFFGGWAQAFTSSTFGTGLLLDLVVVTLMMIGLAVADRSLTRPKK